MNRRRTRAFTLLELLLAMAVGMVVLLVAAQLLGDAGAKCGLARGAIGARREFRFALDQWTSDVSNAVGHLEPEVASTDPGEWSERIGFYLLQPASKQNPGEAAGDLCAVTYYLKGLDSQGRVVRCWMRGLRSSKETFEAFKAGSSETLFAPRESDEPVAFGVVRFEVRAVPSTDAENVSRAFEWRLEIARRDLADQLASEADWEALAVHRSPSQARRIELRSGAFILGHEITP